MQVATPIQANKGGVLTEVIISFFVSIVASVVAYYISKWLDRNE